MPAQISNIDATEIEIQRTETINNLEDKFGMDFQTCEKFFQVLSNLREVAILKTQSQYVLNESRILSNSIYYALAVKAYENLFNLQEELKIEALSICDNHAAKDAIRDYLNV